MNLRLALPTLLAFTSAVSIRSNAADLPSFRGYDKISKWAEGTQDESDRLIQQHLPQSSSSDPDSGTDLAWQNADSRPCALSQIFTIGSEHYPLVDACTVVPWTLVAKDPYGKGQDGDSRIQIKEFRPSTIRNVPSTFVPPDYSIKGGKLNGYLLASVKDLNAPGAVPSEIAALPTIILMPPTGGETPIDDLYADNLSTLGFRVIIIQEWDHGLGYEIKNTYDEDSIRSLWAIQRVVAHIKRDQKAIPMMSRGQIGILGTSVGGIAAAAAYGTIPEITTAVLIVSGAGLPRIIGESKQEGLSALRAARMMVDPSIDTVAKYVSQLAGLMHVDPIHYTPANPYLDPTKKDRSMEKELAQLKAENLYMIRGVADETVRTTYQNVLYYLWQRSYAATKPINYQPDWATTIEACSAKNMKSKHMDFPNSVPKLTCVNADHIPTIEHAGIALRAQIASHFCQKMLHQNCSLEQTILNEAKQKVASTFSETLRNWWTDTFAVKHASDE